MAFDQALAARVRQHLARHHTVAEMRMFGGLAFLLGGHLCCGVHERELIVRLDPLQTVRALGEPHTRVFDLSGRPMRGWILVSLEGLADDAVLAAWLGLGVAYAATLPPKR